ncbi:hypothetical protein B0T09DRAFT_379564 [Sordaria sp. MPI-SDFR-AT-0083]|nr:hypothetical protein B0T09DRAFT_379564 [Sordaria sp. MPI-SDFR-AT-0083]
MSDAQATTDASTVDEANVPKPMEEALAVFQKIQARFEGIEQQQTTKDGDQANIDCLKLQDLQACILEKYGKWENGIAGSLGLLQNELKNALKNFSRSIPQDDLKHPNYVKRLYNIFISTITMYRKIAEEELETEAEEWLTDRRKEENREDVIEDPFDFSMDRLPGPNGGEAEKLENQIEENVNLNIQNTEDKSGQRNNIKKSHETQKKDTLEQSRDYIVMDKPNVLVPLPADAQAQVQAETETETETETEEEKEDWENLKDIEYFLKEHPEKAQEAPTTTLLAFYKDVHWGKENFNDAPDLDTAENIIKTYYDTYKAASKMFGSLSEAGLGEEAERWLEMKREIRAMVRRSLRGRS